MGSETLRVSNNLYNGAAEFYDHAARLPNVGLASGTPILVGVVRFGFDIGRSVVVTNASVRLRTASLPSYDRYDQGEERGEKYDQVSGCEHGASGWRSETRADCETRARNLIKKVHRLLQTVYAVLDRPRLLCYSTLMLHYV